MASAGLTWTALFDLARNLVSDVAYGSTKELLRATLAASLTTLLLASKPSSPNAWWRTWRTIRWQELIKLLGSFALLALCFFFVAERLSERCDFEKPLCGVVIPGYHSPPPPPPPPMKQAAVVVRGAATSVVRYAKQHPFQIAASFGALFLVDLINLAIVVDRLDPVVRLVGLVSAPFRGAAAAIWKLVMRKRAESLASLAASGLKASR